MAEYVRCPKWWCRKRLHAVDVGGLMLLPGQRLTLHLASRHPKLLTERRRRLQFDSGEGK